MTPIQTILSEEKKGDQNKARIANAFKLNPLATQVYWAGGGVFVKKSDASSHAADVSYNNKRVDVVTITKTAFEAATAPGGGNGGGSADDDDVVLTPKEQAQKELEAAQAAVDALKPNAKKEKKEAALERLETAKTNLEKLTAAE